MKVEIIKEEINKYGLKELYYHIRYHQEKCIFYEMKMCREREKRINFNKKECLAKDIVQLYEWKMNEAMDILNPTNFTQKIQWLKLYDSSEIKTVLSDKYLAKEAVAKCIGREYIVPLIGVWDSYEGIDFNSLPECFCLKANHGSGMNYVVRNKEMLNHHELKKELSAWMKMPQFVESIELQYKNIERKIIAEEFIEETSGGLFDYKIHCFGGVPKFIQCIGGRDLRKHTGFQMNYDFQWNKLGWTFEDYPNFSFEVSRPKLLDEMFDIAYKLADGFLYARVDLYEVSGKIYFGEMTFTPAGGYYPYRGSWTREKNIEIGNEIVLPN